MWRSAIQVPSPRKLRGSRSPGCGVVGPWRKRRMWAEKCLTLILANFWIASSFGSTVKAIGWTLFPAIEPVGAGRIFAVRQRLLDSGLCIRRLSSPASWSHIGGQCSVIAGSLWKRRSVSLQCADMASEHLWGATCACVLGKRSVAMQR